jgi:long-chain-alcohol oxidase
MKGRKSSHTLLRGGRRECSYSHGFSLAQIQSLAAICEALIPPLPWDSIGREKNPADHQSLHSFYKASGSQPPIPDEVNSCVYIYIYIYILSICTRKKHNKKKKNNFGSFHHVINMYNMFNFSLNGKQVAELIVKRCIPQAVFLVRLVLQMLSFRLGTLLLCGYLCFNGKWPFILNFSNISLEKREEILKKWSRERHLVPLRIVFVAIKMFCFFNFFSRVMLLIHYGISPFFYF